MILDETVHHPTKFHQSIYSKKFSTNNLLFAHWVILKLKDAIQMALYLGLISTILFVGLVFLKTVKIGQKYYIFKQV